MTTQEKLVGLLREALWDIEFQGDVDSQEVNLLLDKAKEQAVVGLVADVLIRKFQHLDRPVFVRAFSLQSKVKKNNLKADRALNCYVDLMEKTQIRYLVVKGQTIASLYRNPELRTSGDIDFQIFDYPRTRQVLGEAWNLSLPERLQEKEYAFKYEDVLFELHTNLMVFGCKKHQRFWDQMVINSLQRQYVMKVGGRSVTTLDPTTNVVYLFVHLFFHFMREGVGLRQFCDWAVALHNWKEVIDEAELAVFVRQLGLEHAFCAFGSVLTTDLGLKCFPMPISSKEKRAGKKILKDVLRVGNFGKYDRKVKKVGWKFKMETMTKTMANCCKFFWLAPQELLMLIPKQVKINIRLLIN